MSTGTSIEWTDATWVVTTGCTEKSSGCANCYARGMSRRLAGMAKADAAAGRSPGRKAAYALSVLDDGRWSGIVKPVEDALAEPLRWKKPRRVFVNSMSDLFWGDAADLADARRRGVAAPEPVPFEFIDRVFAVMALCPQHTFQVLTKRPERMAEYLRRVGEEGTAPIYDAMPGDAWMRRESRDVWRTRWPLPNVWLGTSVEDQPSADLRIPPLLRCPAAKWFISLEPMLGAVDLTRVNFGVGGVQNALDSRVSAIAKRAGIDRLNGIDLVIVGGESGTRARPCNVAWIRSIVDQCKAAGVPCFVKQLGANPKGDEPPAPVRNEAAKTTTYTVQQVIEINDPKGGDMSEWPADLRVRQMPGVQA